ncbi:MAG: DUF5677 domain-containing protein [Thermoanaerobaculia bacterium]
MTRGTGIGYIAKQTEFAERHSTFFERFPNLMRAINIAFDRTITAKGALDPIIFYLGIRIIDDFEAIVVTAANDLALPAQALLRGMYERIVTVAHLHDNPDDVTAFAEYDYVQRRRVAVAIRDTLGYLPERKEAMEELECDYQRVKGNYEISCDKCGAKRVGPSWSKLDFVTQAKRQKQFAPVIVDAYYLPLLQVHSTLRSASALIEVKDGKPIFRTGHEQLADEVFRLSYVLAINSLQLQLKHFNPPALEQALEMVVQDCLDIYPEPADAEAPEPGGA